MESSEDSLVVTAVQPESAAATAGLQAGNILRAIDGTPIPDREAAIAARDGRAPGDTVTLTLEHDGASLDLDLTFGEGRRDGFGFGRIPSFVGPDADGPRDGFRGFFERFGEGSCGKGGHLPLPEGIFPGGLPNGGGFDMQVLRGEITAIDDASISIACETVGITNETRRPVGPVASGDDVIVFASDGVARVIVPVPNFSRFPGFGTTRPQT